ncbi:hypothetical protein M426DRAFT_155568 [Hypoxylon sp. CI-4A]|nr:hypothetical protein M426DRAFT_155568 [Hypoxylon sp. CI-4A]
MATLTVATVSKMAYLLVLASILSVAFADEATTSSVDTLPNYFNEYVMGITLSADSSPQGVVCKIAPLTTEAGLNQTNENALQAFDIEGNLILVDRTNYNKLSDLEDTIAYISCESSTDNTYLSPEDVLNSVMAAKPKGILLFTTSGAYCNLGGSDLDYTSLWTTTDSEDAGMIKNMTTDSTGGTVHAAITGNSIDSDSDNGQPQGGGNSAVAMSILYSITGLITLLFLIIIATGAIRAHRHPERYGPRPGFNGRPRQSRARGLARAVLETLPIVKFGDPHPSKPDPENELDSISGDRQQNSASPTPRELASDNAEQAGSSPEAAANATSGAISKGTASAAVSGEATGTNGQTEDGHLGCSICTEDFSVGQDVRVLPCDHKFHPQCIDPWLVNVSGTCPLW